MFNEMLQGGKNLYSFFKNLLSSFKAADRILWFIIFLISCFSFLVIKSVPSEGLSYFTVQIIAASAGILGAIIIQSINYRDLANAAVWIGIFCTLFILYTLFFGITVEGSSGVNARAWIKIPGGITFQPSELVKIGFIVTFSKHLSLIAKNEKMKSFKHIFLLVIHAFLPIVLIHLQGDDGAAIIFLCMALFMAFIAGVQVRYFLLAGALGVLMLPVAWKYILADYQKQRIINQLNPESDPLNMGYQQIQGKLSIASGGLSGYGLSNGPRVANGAVPIQESDFIFSVVGEELGFIGCIALLLLLLFLLLRISIIATKSCEKLGVIMCFGFLGLILSQVVFNLGMCLSLLPVMGVTLPFFSAGGSSAACLYLGIGLVQSVFINRGNYIKDEIK